VIADAEDDEESWKCLSITWKPKQRRGGELGKKELDALKLTELKKLVRQLHDTAFLQWKASGELMWAIFRIERGDKRKILHGQSALMVRVPYGLDDHDLCTKWKHKCSAAIEAATITSLDWEWPIGKGLKVHDDPDDLIGYCEVKDAGKVWSERAMLGITENKLQECVRYAVSRRASQDGPELWSDSPIVNSDSTPIAPIVRQ
jgi:hypothetical protein